METFEKGGRRKMQLSFSARALLACDLLTPRARVTRTKAKLEHGQDPTAQGQRSGRHLAMDPQMADCRFVLEKHRAGIRHTCMPSASDLYHFL